MSPRQRHHWEIRGLRDKQEECEDRIEEGTKQGERKEWRGAGKKGGRKEEGKGGRTEKLRESMGKRGERKRKEWGRNERVRGIDTFIMYIIWQILKKAISVGLEPTIFSAGN